MPRWVRGGERPPPVAGEIAGVRVFDLHGTRYYALLYRLVGEERVREARLSAEMVYDAPAAGDRVWITSILGVVDRVERQT